MANGEVEFVVAQGSGRLSPTDEGFTLVLRSSLLGNDKRVIETRREFVLRGDSLRVEMQMKTTAVAALSMHVQAELRRSG